MEMSYICNVNIKQAMNREIILVEVIEAENLNTSEEKAFNNTEKAEAYFTKILKEKFDVTDEEEIEEALDNGYYDSKNLSVSIKEITFEED